MNHFPEELIFDIEESDRENILTGYEGEEPPNNTRLSGVIKRAYLAIDKENKPLVKLVCEAVGGDYDGYAAWENISIKPSAAFKWAPLCDHILGITVADLKTQTIVDRDNETGAGWPVTLLGGKNVEDYPIEFTVGYRNYTDPDTKITMRQVVLRDIVNAEVYAAWRKAEDARLAAEKKANTETWENAQPKKAASKK